MPSIGATARRGWVCFELLWGKNGVLSRVCITNNQTVMQKKYETVLVCGKNEHNQIQVVCYWCEYDHISGLQAR